MKPEDIDPKLDLGRDGERVVTWSHFWREVNAHRGSMCDCSEPWCGVSVPHCGKCLAPVTVRILRHQPVVALICPRCNGAGLLLRLETDAGVAPGGGKIAEA